MLLLGKRLKTKIGILRKALRIYEAGLNNKRISTEIKNRNQKAVIGGALSIALRENRKIVPLEQVGSAIDIDPYEIGKMSGFLAYVLNIPLPERFYSPLRFFLLRKVEEKHVLSNETHADAERFFKEAYENGVESENGEDVSAAATLIAVRKTKGRVTLKEISEVYGLDEKVVLKHVAEIIRAVKLKL